MKVCNTCHASKDESEFKARKGARDGLRGECRNCSRGFARRYVATPRAKELMSRWAKSSDGKARLQLHKAKYRAKPETLKKRNTHNIVGRAIQRGILVRLPCEVCGNPRSEGHHEDYTKPLAVKWLCRKHHRAAHWKEAA